MKMVIAYLREEAFGPARSELLDGDTPTIVDTVLRDARTGSIGDGKAFVLPVEQAYRIRTGAAGEDTLLAHPRVLAALQGARHRGGRAARLFPLPGRPATTIGSHPYGVGALTI